MRILSLIIVFYLFIFFISPVLAIYDPLQIPNNKIGIHILFPSELHEAAKLVNNSDQAAWGYILVPIQASDRNRKKWQNFLDDCRVERVIPIIRVATVPEGSSWIQPNSFDLIDFANFLNDLKWPVQNRYIILFNEVNRPDEYGGTVSPESYADILSNAIDIFKERSADFFILPAGLDNAAANYGGALSWSTYLNRMYRARPDIFSKIDGWTSHAYPNPEFSARPDKSGGNKIDSYRYDLKYLKKFTSKTLPVFITEAGWSNKNLSDRQVSLYYQYAFSKVWSDPQIVAITPFLFNAQDGPFKQFSFLDQNHKLKEFSYNLSVLATVGQPVIVALEVPPEIIEAPVVIDKPIPVAEKPTPFKDLNKLYSNIKSLFGLTN